MGLRFTYVGKKGENDLDMGPRLLRELGPFIEGELQEDVGDTEVTRDTLGRSLIVKVRPRSREMGTTQKVKAEIGEAILGNLMSIALDNPGGPVISATGQLAQGGRVDGKRLGL